MKVLLTGFENFLQHPYNPTQLVVEMIASKSFGEHQLTTCVLPVSFEHAREKTRSLLETGQYTYHIALGLAASRKMITPEVVAINLAHNPARPDNSNLELYLTALKEDGPLALKSSLPLKSIEQALNGNGHQCELSFSAGTYVCNAVMYEALHCIQKNGLETRSGFIHLPPDNKFAPETSAGPSIQNLTQAVEMIITNCLT